MTLKHNTASSLGGSGANPECSETNTSLALFNSRVFRELTIMKLNLWIDRTAIWMGRALKNTITMKLRIIKIRAPSPLFRKEHGTPADPWMMLSSGALPDHRDRYFWESAQSTSALPHDAKGYCFTSHTLIHFLFSSSPLSPGSSPRQIWND